MKGLVNQPAHIEVTISGFVDIIHDSVGPGYPRLCNASWKLVTPAPTGITQPGGAGTTIIVKTPMKIDFDLLTPDYTIAGITFKRILGGGPGNGSADMKKEDITIEPGGLTIHTKDSWQNHGKPPTNPWNWDFYLFVQNSSGEIGIIDPDIQNEE